MKHACYLALRNGELCCIYLLDCPKGLQPEIPSKPYHLFPIKKLSLDCVKPRERQGKKNLEESKFVCVTKSLRREKNAMESYLFEKRFSPVVGVGFCVDFVVYLTITCLLIRKIKTRNNWSEIKTDLTLYFYLLVMYELSVLVLTKGSYLLWSFTMIYLYCFCQLNM